MKLLAQNKTANLNYEILDKFESGIVLESWEVKSVLLGHISLKESYVKIIDGHPYLWNAHIPKYKFASNLQNLSIPELSKLEYRSRKLLMHKKEILRISQRAKVQALTIIPLQMYMGNSGKVKVQIALAKGKRNFDKRESIKSKDIEMELRRFVKDK